MFTDIVPNIFRWKELLGIRFLTAFHGADEAGERQNWDPKRFCSTWEMFSTVVGKHFSLLILFTMHKSVRSNLARTVDEALILCGVHATPLQVFGAAHDANGRCACGGAAQDDPHA